MDRRPHAGGAGERNGAVPSRRVSDQKDLKCRRALSRVRMRASRSPVAMDEMFELFDNELLITDNAFHHVANRNYAS
jgi:hypothetical protein